MSDALPQADRNTLARVTEQLCDEKGWASFVTFDGLLRDWSVFVSRLERGYDSSIYEYENDLDTREILGEVLAAAPADIRPRLAAMLNSLDDRFMSVTRPVDHPVTGGPNPSGWYRRIPAKLGPELTDDLKHYGVL